MIIRVGRKNLKSNPGASIDLNASHTMEFVIWSGASYGRSIGLRVYLWTKSPISLWSLDIMKT